MGGMKMFTVLGIIFVLFVEVGIPFVVVAALTLFILKLFVDFLYFLCKDENPQKRWGEK